MSTNPTVPILLNGGRVLSAFRAALFASAARAGTTVNEFVLIATAEKLQRSGAGIDGVFEPGDVEVTNDNHSHPEAYKA